jgi:hypothetical protein
MLNFRRFCHPGSGLPAESGDKITHLAPVRPLVSTVGADLEALPVQRALANVCFFVLIWKSGSRGGVAPCLAPQAASVAPGVRAATHSSPAN